MNIQNIKRGDIFEHEYNLKDRKIRHRSRVLFVGEENIFFDEWWEGLNKWTFVPVKKNCSYYRLPLDQLNLLSFNGFEEICDNDASKLFLNSPEILLRTTKDEISKNLDDNTIINTHSPTIAFVPLGPKRGLKKAILIDTTNLTISKLVNKILEVQNLDYITTNKVTLHRIGLHKGMPSYCIKTG